MIELHRLILLTRRLAEEYGLMCLLYVMQIVLCRWSRMWTELTQ